MNNCSIAAELLGRACVFVQQPSTEHVFLYLLASIPQGQRVIELSSPFLFPPGDLKIIRTGLLDIVCLLAYQVPRALNFVGRVSGGGRGEGSSLDCLDGKDNAILTTG